MVDFSSIYNIVILFFSHETKTYNPEHTTLDKLLTKKIIASLQNALSIKLL